MQSLNVTSENEVHLRLAGQYRFNLHEIPSHKVEGNVVREPRGCNNLLY